METSLDVIRMKYNRVRTELEVEPVLTDVWAYGYDGSGGTNEEDTTSKGVTEK